MALLAMVLMATACSFGSSTIAGPVTGPRVLSVLALSAHHPVITMGGSEVDRPRELGADRVIEPEMIGLELLRLGNERLNLPPPGA